MHIGRPGPPPQKTVQEHTGRTVPAIIYGPPTEIVWDRPISRSSGPPHTIPRCSPHAPASGPIRQSLPRETIKAKWAQPEVLDPHGLFAKRSPRRRPWSTPGAAATAATPARHILAKDMGTVRPSRGDCRGIVGERRAVGGAHEIENARRYRGSVLLCHRNIDDTAKPTPVSKRAAP